MALCGFHEQHTIVVYKLQSVKVGQKAVYSIGTFFIAHFQKVGQIPNKRMYLFLNECVFSPF